MSAYDDWFFQPLRQSEHDEMIDQARDDEIERLSRELCDEAMAGKHTLEVLADFDADAAIDDHFDAFVAGIVCESKGGTVHELYKLARIVEGWRSRCEAWARAKATEEVNAR